MKTKLGANTPTITLSEAVTWVAYGKIFYSREDVKKWYRSNRGRLPQAIQKKLDTAGDQVVHLMINGVSARGNWQEGDDPPSDSREAVRIDFLKDGVFAQAADDSIYADPEKESHSGAYHSVELDFREFFAALRVPLAEVQEDPPAQTHRERDEPGPQTAAEIDVAQDGAREAEHDALDDAGDGIDRSRIRPEPQPLLEGNVFRREGEIWQLRYQDEVCQLKDTIGLRYISHLLQNPGQHFHIADLQRTVNPPTPQQVSAEFSDLTEAQLNEYGLSTARGAEDLFLDDRAIVEIKRKLERLQERIDEAEEFGKTDLRDELKGEREEILVHFRAGRGLGGRPRKTNDPVEKIRKTVSKAIARDLKKIESKCPILGAHLNNTIHTGTHCVYLPEQDPAWSS